MVEILMLSKITLCKLLVVECIYLAFCLWIWCQFSKVNSLWVNSFDEVCKDLETLLGSSTLSEWLFFMTVVVDKVRLVDLDTLFTALFVPWSVSAVLLTLVILLLGIILFTGAHLWCCSDFAMIELKQIQLKLL